MPNPSANMGVTQEQLRKAIKKIDEYDFFGAHKAYLLEMVENLGRTTSLTGAAGSGEVAKREDALATALCLLDTFTGEGLCHTYGNGQEIHADTACAELAEAFDVDLEPGWYRKVAAIAAQNQGDQQ